MNNRLPGNQIKSQDLPHDRYLHGCDFCGRRLLEQSGRRMVVREFAIEIFNEKYEATAACKRCYMRHVARWPPKQ